MKLFKPGDSITAVFVSLWTQKGLCVFTGEFGVGIGDWKNKIKDTKRKKGEKQEIKWSLGSPLEIRGVQIHRLCSPEDLSFVVYVG